MSRQEATNTWSEGLIMDLNPINTPDNCLTDALNATIITYNGNEFILQNDQGNYPLQNCKLRPNFIPIGLKQYSDILYIVSYNPLTEETEIGSYPSPRTIFNPEEENGVELTPCISVHGTYQYTDIIQNAELQMFTVSSDMETYKLNPGDEFWVATSTSSIFPYQEVEWSILTEEKKLIPVELPVGFPQNYPGSPTLDDYKFVPWKIPGWLTGKYRLAVPDQFYLNIREISIPEFFTDDDGSFTVSSARFNVQIECSDPLLHPATTAIRDDLKVEYELSTDGGQTFTKISPSVVEEGTHTYNDAVTTYWQDIELPSSNLSVNSQTIWVLRATPYIQNGSTVYYDQFKTELEINFANVMSAQDITAADVIYKYIVDSDSCSLTFNINGPFINNSNITSKLEIRNLCSDVIGNPIVIDLNDINFFGQNTFDIPFGDGFIPENMYILSFVFYEGSTLIKRINNLFIVSKLFNAFYDTYTNFNNISLDQWLDELVRINKERTFSVTSTPITSLKTRGWSPTGSQTYINQVKVNAGTGTITIPQDGSYQWVTDSPSSAKFPSFYYGGEQDVRLSVTGTELGLINCLWQGLSETTTVSGSISVPEQSNKNFTNISLTLNGPATTVGSVYLGREIRTGYELVPGGSIRVPINLTMAPSFANSTASDTPVCLDLVLQLNSNGWMDNSQDQRGTKISRNSSVIAGSNLTQMRAMTLLQNSKQDKHSSDYHRSPATWAGPNWKTHTLNSNYVAVYIVGINCQDGDASKYYWIDSPYGKIVPQGQGRTSRGYALFATPSTWIAVPFEGNTEGTALGPLNYTQVTSNTLYRGMVNSLNALAKAILYVKPFRVESKYFINASTQLLTLEEVSITNFSVTNTIDSIMYRGFDILRQYLSLNADILTQMSSIGGYNNINNNLKTDKLDLSEFKIITTIEDESLDINLSSVDLSAASAFNTKLSDAIYLQGTQERTRLESDPVMASGMDPSRGGFIVDPNVDPSKKVQYENIASKLAKSSSLTYINGIQADIISSFWDITNSLRVDFSYGTNAIAIPWNE